MVLHFPQVFQSNGINLTQTLNEIYVEFQQELSLNKFNKFIKEYDLEIPIQSPIEAEGEPGQTGPIVGAWLCGKKRRVFDQFYPQVLSDECVRIASPVYHRADLLPERTAITFSDRLLVKFWPHVVKKEIKEILKKTSLLDISSGSNLLGHNLCYVQLHDPDERHALHLADQLARFPAVKRAGPDWIQLYPGADERPSDTLIDEQWHLTQIQAEQGWDVSHGDPDTIIAMLDMGFDLEHDDLEDKFVSGCDATIGDDCGYELNFQAHGTQTSGVAAANTNNAEGIAGVAWDCRLMPIRIARDPSGGCVPVKQESWIIRGLRAAREAGAKVINMSFAWIAPEVSLADTLEEMHAHDIVMVASSGNSISSYATPISGLASHERVIAVGATNRDDQRQTATDEEDWYSKYGSGLSVVAPGIAILTTYHTHNGCSHTSEPYGPLSGTSFSAPQVAGLAALLRSEYPHMSAVGIRNVIERSAEKVGGYIYSSNPDYPNGRWNEEMGYGRINMSRALDFADVYIKDNPAHDGSMIYEGNFYSESDIIVRSEDNNVFEYEGLTRDQVNYVYVRVNNGGPASARNVQVSVRAVNFSSTEFVYDYDWTFVDETTHLEAIQFDPDPLASTILEADTSSIFKFTLTSEQVHVLDGWTHPCLLAEVRCDNDYCDVPDGAHTWEHNNLAQRNISFAPVIIGARYIYPFISGHKKNSDPYMELLIDRGGLPKKIELLLDPREKGPYFPAFEQVEQQDKHTITFLDRTRLATSLCGCKGILTLEAGSSFRCMNFSYDKITLQGAEFVERDGKQLIAIRENEAVIGLQKQPGEVRPMSLTLQVPDDAKYKDRYRVDVRQRNMKQQVVGGVAFVVHVKK